MTIDTVSVPAPYPIQAPGAVLPAGANGASAFELAVMLGFVGNLAQWLAAQKGEEGEPGPPGPTTIEGLTDASDVFKALNVATSKLQRQALGALGAGDDASTLTVQANGVQTATALADLLVALLPAAPGFQAAFTKLFKVWVAGLPAYSGTGPAPVPAGEAYSNNGTPQIAQ